MRRILPAVLLCMAVAAVPGIAVSQQDGSGDGPDTLNEIYKEWAVRCVALRDGGRLCEMFQERRQTETGRRVLAIALTRSEQGAVLSVVGPFGTLLDEGIRILVDGKEVLPMRYRTCMPDGCVARSEIPAAAIETFAKGKEATVRVVALDGNPVEIKTSLSGFTAAWKRLSQLYRTDHG